MVARIVTEHGITSPFWNLPSCFYYRNEDYEEAFCYPYTQNIDESRIGELPYSVSPIPSPPKTNLDRDIVHHPVSPVQRKSEQVGYTTECRLPLLQYPHGSKCVYSIQPDAQLPSRAES